MKEYNWLSDDQYQKLLFHIRTQFTASLNVFDCHGLGAHIPAVVQIHMEIAERALKVVRGKDIPINVLDKPLRRAID